jgi:HPt (histidine-containing phosphotransfer) domain-containing protein
MNSRVTIGSAPLDLRRFADRLDGDVHLMRELAGLYIADYPRQLAELRDAVSSHDPRQMHLAAHTIRGTATNFAAEAAAKAAEYLEHLAESGNLSDASEAVNAVAVELERLHLALEAFLASG